MSKPERPILRYFGGKWILAPWIIEQFPPHKIYCEPFGGSASVLMRKPRSYAEVYNDMDGDVVNLFRVLQSQILSVRLHESLWLTPYSREEFNLGYEQAHDPVERARRLIIRAYMGFGSNGHNANERTGFRANSNRSGTTPAHDWVNYPNQIENFCERLAGVVIENRDAFEVIEQQDSEETLFFLDPPYVHSTRGVVNGYVFEMSDDQHVKLCELLGSVKGMVILCGYENEIYSRLGWHRIERAAHADGAKERTEVLWLNPAAAKAGAQQSLFGSSP